MDTVDCVDGYSSFAHICACFMLLEPVNVAINLSLILSLPFW